MPDNASYSALPQQPEEEHYHPPYWKVFLILLALTATEMFLAFAPPSIFWLAASCMVIIAIVKISYIARYFMHLKFDEAVLSLIAAVPLVFGSFLAIGLLMDFS